MQQIFLVSGEEKNATKIMFLMNMLVKTLVSPSGSSFDIFGLFFTTSLNLTANADELINPDAKPTVTKVLSLGSKRVARKPKNETTETKKMNVRNFLSGKTIP